jgi:hypothetical protein
MLDKYDPRAIALSYNLGREAAKNREIVELARGPVPWSFRRGYNEEKDRIELGISLSAPQTSRDLTSKI